MFDATSHQSAVADGRSAVMRAVLTFHQKFGLPCRSVPNARLDTTLARLRVDILREEVDEFADASRNEDVVAVADALGDIVYAAYGAAITYGIDLDAVLTEIHRSNMSKLDTNGRPVFRADGKVTKSSQYQAPRIADVLASQRALPCASDLA